MISEQEQSYTINKLFREITNELNNRYYEIMYGKCRSKKEDAE